MTTIERFLCEICRQQLDGAGLVYKKVPGTEGEKQRCDWCKEKHYGARYLIRFGRDE